MQLGRGIRHLLAGSLALMLAVGLAAAYWAFAGRDSLLLRDDNPRRIEALASIQRGSIYDREGQLLADTVAGAGALERRYPRPSAYSAVGYYSLRYGVSGAEAAFDDLLSGSRDVRSLSDYLQRNLLRSPRIGSDIRLTLDAEIQDALASAWGDGRGAAVVLNARNGTVAALFSQPSFDPNSLDADWDDLVAAEGQPFFNRALQSHYQLGGAMYTVLLAEAIRSRTDLSMLYPQSAASVEFEDDLTISCAIAPKATDLTLIDAFIYGCPAPFLAFFLAEPAMNLNAISSQFLFPNPIALDGFPQPEPIELPSAPSAETLSNAAAIERAALGQGNLTATPLHMAAIMAAVATDGSIKTPTIHAATRAPGEKQWQATTVVSSSTPVVSAEVAKELRVVMRRAWSILPVDSITGDTGAQVATSQSGEASQIWLNGFIAGADGGTYSFAIVLEDNDDLSRLLSVGQALVRTLALP